METLNSFIPVEYVLTDVLIRADDEETRKGYTKGWYISMIQQALEKLAVTTHFSSSPPLDVPMPTNLRWQIPDDLFNIRELYAFNGDCCDISSSANIYWKRNFNNAPNGNGYTALNKGDQQSSNDPYFYGWLLTSNQDNNNNYLFANIQGGYLMFSTACSGYTNFRVVYDSMGGEIGARPLIPRLLRGACTDLACELVFEAFATRFPKSAYGAAYDRVYKKLYNTRNGTFWDAQIIVKDNHSWMQEMRGVVNSNYANW